MKVTLLNYTQNAKEILIFSKRTRLELDPEGLDKIMNMPDNEKDEEIKYVFGTIGSSWEFIDYIILITGVSRAFTHQLVRHRIASYGQQSQRTVDMSKGFLYISTGKCKSDTKVSRIYSDTMDIIKDQYSALIKAGANIEDARGVLPTNIGTNILMKMDLRNISAMLNERLCLRVQDEFREVAKKIKNVIVDVHPWAEPVLEVGCVQYGYCKFKNFKECPMKISGAIKDFDSAEAKKYWNKING